MPSSITIHELSYIAPDARKLFSRLNLTINAGKTGIIGRNGVGKSTLAKLFANTLLAASGSITRNGTLAYLRQDLAGAGDERIVDLFEVRPAWLVLQKALAGEATADELSDVDWTLEERIAAALASLGLVASPETPLANLSGGQRVRAALAALEFGQPDIIVLDEPTNNLDAEGREAVAAMLKRWRGTAIVVSHDRDLLELMDEIVELTTLGAKTYGGNYSAYQERKGLELAAAQRGLDVAERERREAGRAAQQAKERQDKRDAGGRKAGAKGGIPKIILGGLQSKAEGTASALRKIGQKNMQAADEAVVAARESLEVLVPFAVKLAPSGVHASKVILRASGVSGGYDAERPVIENFDLELIGPERVALVGRNGAGKSTALKLLTGELTRFSGSVHMGGSVAVLDQDVSFLRREETVLENFLRLNPQSTGHEGRAVLAAFKFRNEAALQTVGTLSGGEVLRAGLACVLGGTVTPMLIVLDEPTNHLDIEAVEVVEAGLREYDGALLVVSHDQRFLEQIGVTRRVEIGGMREGGV